MTVDMEQQSPAIARSQRGPLLKRWASYLAERFPLLGHGVLIFSFYSSNQFLAHALAAPGEPMRYDPSTLIGALAVLCIFLQLRIFDDHKDYVEDCRHFPDRVLQRGEVTLRDLKWLLALVIGAEVLLAAIRGPGAFVSILMVMGFSLLMLKEFFARDWLRQRFLIYASTHMLIVPLLAIAIFSFATGDYPWQAPGWYWLYSVVGFCVAFNWEVSRKIRAPEEEKEGIDTYTKRFGTYGAAYLVLAIRVVDTALVTLVGMHVGLSGWFYAWLLILFAVCTIGFFQFRFRTSAVTARRMQTYAGLYIVAFDWALAVELGRKYGLGLSETLP
jgi:4-hydroxybenzoate polyprenyltransferase